MGLDVYLMTKEQCENNRLHQKEEEDFYGGEEWPLYDSKSATEKEEFRRNRKFPDYASNTDVPSEKYGNGTLNNRRYLRSSYNGGGFNSAVPQMLGYEATYDWIFGEVKEYGDYRVPLDEGAVPRLLVAHERALKVAADLRALKLPLKAVSVSPGGFATSWPTLKAEDALTWARDALGKPVDPFFGDGGWSSREGDYFGSGGLKVVAAVPGVDILNTPAVHLVYEMDPEVKSTYIESADIVVEFVDECLKLIEQDGSCELHWSG